jgi:hypothetical protein
LSKLAKPTQGPLKIIDVQQLSINGTILIQWSPTSGNCCHFLTLQLRTQMLYLSHYDAMTHSHFDTWHHNKISKACRAGLMNQNCKSDSLS